MNAHPENEAVGTVPGGSPSSLRPDDRRADPAEHDAPERTPASGPLLYVPMLLVMLGGFWLMSYGFTIDSGLLFSLGILASGLAFLVPLQLLRD